MSDCKVVFLVFSLLNYFREEMERDAAHVKYLFDRLYKGITSKIPYTYVNGDLSQRYLGNLNISFAYVEGESLLLGLPSGT